MTFYLTSFELIVVHSPYTSSPVALYIGPRRQQYYVPRVFLQGIDWIASRSWGGVVPLPDVDEITGHVLVHYLHTGVYQTLDDVEPPAAGRADTEFKRAFLVYIAAKKYGIQNLSHLAKREMKHFGAKMSVFDIIEAVREDFSRTPDNAIWVQRYLERRAKAAFEADHTVFAKDDWLDRFENGDLVKFLAKCVVQLYSSTVSRLLGTEKEPVRNLSEEFVVDAPGPSVAGASTEECHTPNLFAEVCPALDPVTDCPAPERSTEEPITAPEPLVSKIDVLQAPNPEPILMNQVDSLQDDDGWGFPTYSSKKKKKGKKKTGEEPHNMELQDPEPEPEPSLAIAEEPIHDDWGIWEGTTKKDKKKRKKIAISSEVVEPPEPEPEPVTEPVEFEPVEEAKEDDPWAFSLPKKNGKKKKKSTWVDDAIPPSPPPEPATEENGDDRWSSWGWPTASKKGKKSKDTPIEVPEPSPNPPEPVCEREPETNFVVAEPIIFQETVTAKELQTEQPPEVAEDGICAVRAKHLLEGNEWKGCKQCRTMVHQVAIQLARAVNTDEDEYEVIDRILVK